MNGTKEAQRGNVKSRDFSKPPELLGSDVKRSKRGRTGLKLSQSCKVSAAESAARAKGSREE